MCIAFSASISLSTSKCLHTNTRDLRREFDPSLIVPHRYLEPDRRLHFAASSTVIEEDVHGTMVGVRHNHADRSILSCASEDVEHFYDALHKLDSALENHTIRVRPVAGRAVMVMNRRILHGREAFSGGRRNFVGFYVGQDEYDTTARLFL